MQLLRSWAEYVITVLKIPHTTPPVQGVEISYESFRIL